MNTTTTSTTSTLVGRCGRWLRRFAGVATISAIALTAVSTVDSASAWSYATPSGRPGSVGVATIYVGDLYSNGQTNFTLYGNVNVTANRSPGSTGAQTVAVRYYVQQFVNGQWVNAASSPVLTGTIGASQTSVRFAPPYLRPSVARGYTRLLYVFAWVDSAGRPLGSVSVVPNLASDLVCVTQVRLCQASAGYVRTGGYLTNAW